MKKLVTLAFVALLINTAYVAGFPSPTVFYVANVLLHVALGLVAAIGLRWLWQQQTWIPAGFYSASLIFALWLIRFGATRPNRWVLILHVASAVIGTLALLPYLYRRNETVFRAVAAGLALVAILPASAKLYNRYFPDPTHHIRNSQTVPLSMQEEGGGPKSPFWPSAAKTNVGGIIPSDFFMDSKRCGECHQDIYEQWQSSMHHFASFNNQYYRKSIEYMQDIGGTQGTKWCAGCHDHAVFFNGRFDRPIKEQIDTPEAQNGLGCLSCHSITEVHGSAGNGGFTMTYPPLHELASSKNKYVKALDDFVTYLNPEPHRQTFLKPFMREAEYCASCHKVHLDVPVNNYRWQRGFNDYDNWQASRRVRPRRAIVLLSARIAHLLRLPYAAGRVSGILAIAMERSTRHRFPAANTAVRVRE